ncbi:MAG: AbrB/MazE/SpoVT family DNA-binding domain-containing protein [Candidatus Thorarchaeota archaeon]
MTTFGSTDHSLSLWSFFQVINDLIRMGIFEGVGVEMGIVEIDDRGRITIPKAERDRLGLKPGERVAIREKNGELIIKKLVTSEEFITNLKGCITIPDDRENPLELKRIWRGMP